MNSDELSAGAGIALSLAMSYIPGLRDKWATLQPDVKRAILAGIMLAISVGIFAAGCGGILKNVPCDQTGALGLLRVLAVGLIANQTTYAMSPAVKP
jgi:hypothetical protein